MRPESLNPLFAEVTSVAGVGAAAARQLERLEIRQLLDLLFHLPTGWQETRNVDHLLEASAGERVALTVEIVGHEDARGRGPARALAQDMHGTDIMLAFFGRHANGMARRLREGQRLMVAGKLDIYNGRYQMVHPESASGPVGPEAIYPLTAGLTSRRLARWVAEALERLPVFEEWIEPSLLAKQGWPGFAEALAAVHRKPGSTSASDRLAYDELLAGQLAWGLVRQRRRKIRGVPVAGDGRLLRALWQSLPFQLTGAQRRVIEEVRGDLAQPHAMLRLLQGDVGSGKTVVALATMLMAVEAGAQAAMLAPTDLLARQHLATLTELTQDLPVKLGFLSGREKGKARREVLEALQQGEIDMLVGTHAIFQPEVAYRSLAVAVVDEQHRFGVAQRMMLSDKAERPPHFLVMTATPIPRTLALANYGEMDVSQLDERPPGRQPVDTRIIPQARIDELIAGVGRHLARGEQAYWVCPMLESELEGEAGAMPAVRRAEMLAARFGPEFGPEFGHEVGLVHGKLAGPARDREMARFSNGEVRLLVATTVVEVGVDVPNATLMVIEAAERFGLAQLHQLRGRVGRGSGRSICILLRSDIISDTARQRLAMMRATDDGFAIAEADLDLRGAGEVLGTRQSGEVQYRLADDAQVARLAAVADQDARMLMEHDGGLDSRRGEAARKLLYLFEKDAAVQLLRSG